MINNLASCIPLIYLANIVDYFCCFSGGLTNLLYLCTIPSHINVCDNEPRRVLLRIYGEIAKTSKEFLLRNSVIFAILSEKKLGPKLYCMHPEGRLEEYIPVSR